MFIKNILLLGYISFLVTSICAAMPSAIDGGLEDFIQRMVPQEDHQEFRLFYNQVVYEQQRDKQSTKQKTQKKQKDYAQHLYSVGKSGVFVRDPLVAASIKPYLAGTKKIDTATQQKLSAFLFRYGAYEEYLQQKALKQNSIASRARSYMRDVKHRCVTLFNNGKKLFSRGTPA